jgi:hypothetical protein
MSDDAVWERLRAMMPLCSCGQRLEPGGAAALGCALVCASCSYVEMVAPAWVDAQVAEARAAVDAEVHEADSSA